MFVLGLLRGLFAVKINEDYYYYFIIITSTELPPRVLAVSDHALFREDLSSKN